MNADQKRTFDRAFPNGRKGKEAHESRLHEQVCNYLLAQYPKVRFISSLTGEHQGNVRIRARNKNIQWGAGQPDLLIPHNNGIRVGLAIELKRLSANPWKKDGNLRKSEHLQQQAAWLEYFVNQGWYACFVVGFDQAKDVIDKYMKRR